MPSSPSPPCNASPSAPPTSPRTASREEQEGLEESGLHPRSPILRHHYKHVPLVPGGNSRQLDKKDGGADAERGADASGHSTDDGSDALRDDLSASRSPCGSPSTQKTSLTHLPELLEMDPCSPTGEPGIVFVPEEDDTGRRGAYGWRHPRLALARLQHAFSRAIPRGGLVSNTYTLASATLGAGIVSVPSGFHDSGIIVALFLLVCVCGATIYSLRLLAVATHMTGLHSYEALSHELFGPGWDAFTVTLMFLFCWGTCVGYVIAVGDLLTPLIDVPGASPFLRSVSGRRWLTSLVWLVGMLTLSLPKQINSLRYASVIGVGFVIFFVVCVVVHSIQNGLTHGRPGELILANSGMEAINGLSLFIFAFLNQPNEPEVYAETPNASPRKMTRDAAISMTCVMVLNFFSGFFGYLDFGEEVTGSTLLLYKPREDLAFLIAYIGLCGKLCVGFAICLQPTRDTVYYALGWGRATDVRDGVNWVISGSIAFTALICGLFIPNITIVFSLLGGICGGFLGFMFPAYFYMYAGGFTLKNVGIWNYAGCLILIVGGVVAVVFGTGAAIYGEVTA